jgi:hypothetical protein
MRLTDEPASAYTSEERIFYSERYGGKGVVANGGGARCGVDDVVQIKGIGRTPLAGSEAEFWHSYGGETVAGGVRDAIWGEICHGALPYGATRVHGIIATNTHVPLFSADGQTGASTRRGLTVREAVLRPAHFVRSLYFKKQDEQAANLMPDAMRTRHAIESIGPAFAELAGCSAKDSSSHIINSGLLEMFRRFAVQAAAARAKKIVHGAITASNIAFDGRWLDFGTASTVSDYGRIMLSKGPDALSHDPIAVIARDLIYYLKKYCRVDPATLLCEPELMNSYMCVFSTRLRVEYLKLLGLPEHALSALPQADTEQMLDCMIELTEKGNQQPFYLYDRTRKGHTLMPEKMGRYHLNSILIIATFSDNETELDSSLRDQMEDGALLVKFSRSYWNLRRHYLSHLSVDSRPVSKIFLCLNALRLNATLPSLYGPTLDQDIDECVLSGRELDTFIEHRIGMGRTQLNDPVDGTIDLSAWSARKVSLHEHTGFRLDGVRVSIEAGLDCIGAAILDTHRKESLKRKIAMDGHDCD